MKLRDSQRYLHYILIGCMLVFSFGCSDDEVEPPTALPYSFFNNPIVNTGYYAHDLNGSLIRAIGLPNTLRELAAGSNTFRIVTFPNPVWYGEGFSATGFWSISFNEAFAGRTGKAWLVRASASAQESQVIFENGSYLQNTGDPFVVWEGTYSGQFLRVPIPVNEDSDYRIYIELEGRLMYDNLAVREFLTY
ncbi:MAG: hypothetical protein AAGC47_01770 [Bacteroidota bacterium]